MSNSCGCNYALSTATAPCISCVNVANVAAAKAITQKRIWNQVRTGSSMYTMNLASLTVAENRLASNKNVNWNQMSDQVLAAKQPSINSSHGNSLRQTLTSDRPGAATPGGSGVDVKHDSYARYLNRKKASNLKTQTTNIATKALNGNKTNMTGLLANSINCCR
jgi:hypothetical protein